MRPTPTWKVITDYSLGLACLLVAVVPMIVIAGAIFVDSGGPILVRQRRIGRDGHEYYMWKFRTLPTNTPQVAKSELASGELNATRLGRFMRRYSLDELPQLGNVLVGNMSLVGPRPALYTQLDLTQMRAEAGALAVKPGLTGLAQIGGRENLPLAEKVALDAKYAREMSLILDLTILLRTVGAVLRPRGSF